MREDPLTTMPARIGSSRRTRLASGLGCAVALVVVSCTPKLTPAPAASNVPAPTEEAFRLVAVVSPGALVVSPDGSMLAVSDVGSHVVSLTSDTGTPRGSIGTVLGPSLSIRWLPNSEALYAWPSFLMGNSVAVLRADGTAGDEAIGTGDVQASPDSRWLAGSRLDASSRQTDLGVVSLDTRASKVVAHGSLQLLGWRESQIVYRTDSVVHLVTAATGSDQVWFTLAGRTDVHPASGQTTSPDGTILIVAIFAPSEERLLFSTSTGFEPVPTNAVDTESGLLWTRAHDVLAAATSGNLELLDLSSGTIDLGSACHPDGPIDAIAGTTVAYRLANVVHLCDLTTSTDTDLGPEPVDGDIQAAGPLGFVLHGLGETYAISSTAH